MNVMEPSDLIWELRKTGLTRSQIASEVGVTPETITNIQNCNSVRLSTYFSLLKLLENQNDRRKNTNR